MRYRSCEFGNPARTLPVTRGSHARRVESPPCPRTEWIGRPGEPLKDGRTGAIDYELQCFQVRSRTSTLICRKTRLMGALKLSTAREV